MRSVVSFLVLLLLLNSCSHGKADVDVRKALGKDSSGSAATILFTDPRPVDSSGVVYYPLLFQRSTEGGFASSYDGERTSYWNLLFLDTRTGARHLLSEDRRMIIGAVHTGNSSSGSYPAVSQRIEVARNWILYDVIVTDYNGDGMLDAKDPTSLFISDRAGFGFRQLSPEGYDVVSWQPVAGTAHLTLLARRDDNGDKRFDEQDRNIPFTVDRQSGEPARPAFAPAYVDTLHRTLRRLWQRRQ